MTGVGRLSLSRLRYVASGRGLCLALGLLGLVSCRRFSSEGVAVEPREAERLAAITTALAELDPELARARLEQVSGATAMTDPLRAELALLVGDCEGALGLLTARSLVGEAAHELREVAEGCARVMAGAEVVTHEDHRVWIRLQNSRDRVLVPAIAEVADRAVRSMALHLGTELRRPVRIELVSDMASLCKITGLPLDAAENTGTVAIARWGRVTMLSPRATREGYPWQDTLAHEIAHLVVSRATRDEAPLWLQEGLAKREESRWRKPMPLEDPSTAHQLARRAWREGNAVGIEHLGNSMALLPSAEASSIAYAEVQSFLSYWLEHNGEAALRLLLRDLRELGSSKADSALMSVSGYSLEQWNTRWRREFLASLPERAQGHAADAELDERQALEVAQGLRLGQLLLGRRHWARAAEVLGTLSPRVPRAPSSSAARALAELLSGRALEAAAALGTPAEVSHLDGTWLAVGGRLASHLGDAQSATQLFELSLAFAPTLERVACQGDSRSDHSESSVPPILPSEQPWRSLCLDAIGAPTP